MNDKLLVTDQMYRFNNAFTKLVIPALHIDLPEDSMFFCSKDTRVMM